MRVRPIDSSAFRLALVGGLFLLLTSCSTAPGPIAPVPPGYPATDPALPAHPLAILLERQPNESPPKPLVEIDDPQKYQEASSFNELILDRVSVDQQQTMVAECKKKETAFCYIISRIHALRKAQRKWESPPPPPSMPEPPTIVSFDGEKILEWEELKNSSLQPLLDGMSVLTPAQVELLRQRALKDNSCPNQVAIAVGAHLEDGLPNDEVSAKVAELYEKGAGCYRRGTQGHEGFINRASFHYIWMGEFAKALALLKTVKPHDAFNGRNLYWRWRMYLDLNQPDKAQAAFNLLWKTHPYSFHALAAALQARKDPQELLFKNQTATPEPRSKRSPSTNHLIEAMEICKRYGFQETVNTLARWANVRSRKLEPEVRVYLATLADAHFGVTVLPYLFITNPSMVSMAIWKTIYPRPYWELFQKHQGGLDPYLLLSVARKESKFNPYAISPATAMGLMQIHPNTAERLTGPRTVDLLNPEINIALGSFYLNQLVHEMKGDLIWTLAAYNAGEEAALSWIRRLAVSDSILQMDLITYRETREYVAFILRNVYWYHRLYKGNTEALAWLFPAPRPKTPAPSSPPAVANRPLEAPKNPRE